MDEVVWRQERVASHIWANTTRRHGPDERPKTFGSVDVSGWTLSLRIEELEKMMVVVATRAGCDRVASSS